MNKIKLYLILAGVVVLFFTVGTFLLTAGQDIGRSIFGRGFAESQLKDYVSRVLRTEVNGMSCQAMDTDQNGYVSCDFTTKNQPSTPETIECAAWGLDGFMNRGCKTRLQNTIRPR